jgi:hypothetical protein
MRRRILVLVVVAVAAMTMVATQAVATKSFPWRNHAAPYDFEFDNHIDAHQQSLVKDGMLEGFFYITFTGGIDTESGLAIAEHGDCASPDVDCEVGWAWHGVPFSAEYCGQPEGEHPTWAIEGADKYQKRGYSHFHWLDASEHADGLTIGTTYDGYLLRLTAIDSFFFDHHGGFAITPGIETESHHNLVDDCSEVVLPPA